MNQYTVITADIVRSREHQNSAGKIRNDLTELYQELDTAYPFTLLKGDEIQGVLSGFLPEQLPKTVRSLRFYLYPLKTRVGIGAGSINRERTTSNPWELNGEAFFRAREALDYLKEGALQRIYLKSGHQEIDLILNSLWLLMDLIQSGWTGPQWEATWTYEKAGTYKEAAKTLDIAFQNVEKRCRAANWKEFSRSEENMKQILKLITDGKLSTLKEERITIKEERITKKPEGKPESKPEGEK